jgi:DNA-binding NarL/FixJ family response regulator
VVVDRLELVSISKRRIGWKTQMTLREKSKNTQLIEAKVTPSRSFRKVDRAADYGSESAAGGMRAVRLATTVTAAEQRVLSLVSRAWTNKEIATALGISPATVKRHIEKILAKLGLRNRVEIALFGFTLNGCPHRTSAGCALRQPETIRGKLHPWAD